MEMLDLRKKLQQNIALIGESLVIDPEEKKIGEHTVEHWNTTMLSLAYFLADNVLIVGEPGWGKTTAAKTISAVMTGLPFDLYEAVQIQGHPDQTMETMLARVDLAELRASERVIWQAAIYLNSIIIDEINRLSPGKQAMILNCIDTGRTSYLNDTFFTGKIPFYTTANHPDDGNHIMTPPLLDRFGICVEQGYIGAVANKQIKDAEKNLEQLKNPELTTVILQLLNNEKMDVRSKLKELKKRADEHKRMLSEQKLFVFDDIEKVAIKKGIEDVIITEEADIFMQMISAELNMTAVYGRKRSNDIVDEGNHGKKLASHCTKNGLSYRGIRALENYVKAVAYVLGTQVTKNFVVAVAPYVLGHRLQFTDDFKSKYEPANRSGEFGMPYQFFLAEELVKGVEQNYKDTKQQIDLVIHRYKELKNVHGYPLNDAQRAQVDEWVKNPDKVDHPLARNYILNIKKKLSR